MTVRPRSPYSVWGMLLEILAATLLCLALAFGAIFVWHVSRAGAHVGTHVFVAGSVWAVS